MLLTYFFFENSICIYKYLAMIVKSSVTNVTPSEASTSLITARLKA